MQNLPAAKPELWRAPLKAVERRFALSVQHWCDPGFAQRPYIAALAYDDLVMEVTPADTIGKAIALTGIYEFAPTELVRAYLKEGDFFVDVGANAGYYSLVAARRVGERGRVIAFEPFTRVRQRLLRNIELNTLRQVAVRAEAVGRTRSRVHLAPPTLVGNDGTATIAANAVAGGLDVDCVPLDDLEGVPDLVKVDVEGHEAEVFAGMERLLGNASAPTLLFESFRIAEDRVHLERHGYSVYAPTLRSGRLSLEPVNARTRHYRDWEAPNFWAVKNERGRRFVSDECGAHARPHRST
jgi:FkbM family methyltransferase